GGLTARMLPRKLGQFLFEQSRIEELVLAQCLDQLLAVSQWGRFHDRDGPQVPVLGGERRWFATLGSLYRTDHSAVSYAPKRGCASHAILTTITVWPLQVGFSLMGGLDALCRQEPCRVGIGPSRDIGNRGSLRPPLFRPELEMGISP